MGETFKFDEKVALAKLDAVEKAHKDVVGKHNYNPFFILGKVGNMRAAVKRGVNTPELQKDINELPAEPKQLNPNPPMEVKPQTKVVASSVPPTAAAGLKLPVK